ncbi:MAG: hypothetical protein A3H97_14065 [Acidobacteria bacterium RIFCSPLOWO2_02_FULL_65_29]|nr:MAG: hypothetical protein A3H97_14065 [Acidobacteria bacterium RIFCSPLOWO2_02_FULL_65_29]
MLGAACGAALAVCAAGAIGETLRAEQDAPRTIWDGVYTEAQAVRGQLLYKEHCGYCHRDNLTGGGSEAGAPALVGPIFVHRWRDQPVADLFVTIGTTMPQNKPDTLAPQTVVDIVSFLLKANDVPAGQTELPPEVERLKAIAMPVSRP